MTRIERLGGGGRAAPVGGQASVAPRGTQFSIPEAGTAAGEAGGVAATAPAALLGAMLAAQEAEENRSARRHGEAILGALKALQLGLLGGGGSGAVRELGLLATAAPTAADPALAEVLDAVRLRAAVELARRARGRR